MTISTSDRVTDLQSCDGSTTDFEFDFPILQKSELKVYLYDADDNQTELTLSTDFTIAGSSWSSGGTITTTSTYSSDYSIQMAADTVKTQETVYPNLSAWSPLTAMRSFDKLTMMVQELSRDISRALKVRYNNDTTYDVDILTDGYVIGMSSSALVSGTVLLSDVDSVTGRNDAISAAIAGLNGNVTLLQSVAIANNTTLDDVAYLTSTGTYAGQHYLVVVSNSEYIVYYCYDGITDTLTSYTDNSDGTITATGASGTYTLRLHSPTKVVDTVALLKTMTTTSYDGMVVHVGGYSGTTGQGFDLRRDADEDSSTYAGTDWNDNGLINDKLLAFDVRGHAFSLTGTFLKLTWLGAEDGSDVGNAFYYATTYLKSLAVDTILDIDIYNCTSTVQPPVLNSGYDYHVHLISSKIVNNYRNIIFTSGDAPLKYSGGSGAVAGVYAENIKIQSTDSQVVEIKGTCGCIFRGCEFRTSAANVVDFTNDTASGTFTEFCRFESCRLYGVGIARFIRGDGNDSFHGNMFDSGCVFNLTSDAEWIFQFGDGTNAETGRIIWYNGRCEASMFYSGSNVIEFIHDGTNGTSANWASVRGTMSMEGSSAGWIGTVDTDYLSIYLEHEPCELTPSFAPYNVTFFNYFAINSGGGRVVRGGWKYLHRVKAADDAYDSFYLGVYNVSYTPVQIEVELFAANYRQRTLLRYTGRAGEYEAGVLSTLDNHNCYNSAAYGVPTYALNTDNNDIYVTYSNSSWSAVAVSIYIKITGIASGNLHPIYGVGESTDVTEYTA